MELPKSYHQIKKIREFWEKSEAIDKDVMIKLFDETLLEIELNTLTENEASVEQSDEDFLRSIFNC